MFFYQYLDMFLFHNVCVCPSIIGGKNPTLAFKLSENSWILIPS